MNAWMRLACCLSLCSALSAQAHKPSDSHLLLQTLNDSPATATPGEARVSVQWDMALRDLDDELGLDANGDGRLTWGELHPRWPELQAWAQGQLSIRSAQGLCTPVASDGAAVPALSERSDGRYAALQWQVRCTGPTGQALGPLTVDYHFMANADASHRGLVRLQDAGRQWFVAMGSDRPQHRFPATQARFAEAATATLDTRAPNAAAATTPATTAPQAEPADEHTETPWQQVGRMVVEGVHHIAGGLDHILFLLTLLVVAVWRRTPGGTWQAQPTTQAVWRETLKLVTAFTLSHSLTLTVAVMGWWNPPDRWVESLIALSVLLTAVDNLRPILPGPRWVLVAVFGLVHGFGFAGALHESGLLGEQLLWPLLGFNLGVELGQLMLIAVTLPMALWLRHTPGYRWVAVRAGSAAVAVAALAWLVERSTDTSIVAWLPHVSA